MFFIFAVSINKNAWRLHFVSKFVLKILTLFVLFVYKLKGVTLFKRIKNFAQVYVRYDSESIGHFLGGVSFPNEENFNQISFLLECSFDIFGLDHWKMFNIFLWIGLECIVMKKSQKQIIIHRNGNIKKTGREQCKCSNENIKRYFQWTFISYVFWKSFESKFNLWVFGILSYSSFI